MGTDLSQARRWARRQLRRPLVLTVGYVAAGAVSAVVLLGLDSAVGAESLPTWARVEDQGAVVLVSGFATTILFIVAAILFVRISAVQVNTEPIPARVVAEFLVDPVQRHTMGALAGAIALASVVARELPAPGSPTEQPHLAVGIVGLLPVGATVLIVFALIDGTRSARIDRVVRTLADDCVDVVERTFAPLGTEEDEPPDPIEPADARTIAAGATGRIRRIDENALLRAIPSGSTLRLHVQAGDFTHRDEVVATLTGARPEDGLERRVQRAVVVEDGGALDRDLGYGIGLLTDIAERAASPKSSDATTVREVALHLVVVLRRILFRELPPRHRAHGGRRLLLTRSWSHEDYVTGTIGRIRPTLTSSPELAIFALEATGALVHELEDAGLGDRAEPLHREADLIVERVESEASLAHDADRVRCRADDLGLGRGG